MMRVFVDFNTAMADPEERVLINTKLEPALLIGLRPGLRVTLADGDEAGCMEVEAVVEFDDRHERWLARPDWATKRELAASRSAAATG